MPEYRLLLRQDNADIRLTKIGHNVGLISDERYSNLENKIKQIDEEVNRLNSTIIGATKEVNAFLEKHNSTPLRSGLSLGDLLKRPELNYNLLSELDTKREELDSEVIKQVNISALRIPIFEVINWPNIGAKI